MAGLSLDDTDHWVAKLNFDHSQRTRHNPSAICMRGLRVGCADF